MEHRPLEIALAFIVHFQKMCSFRIFGDLVNYTFLETLGPTKFEKQCSHFFQASYGRHLGFSKWPLFFSEIRRYLGL